jgi:hypothetical protein
MIGEFAIAEEEIFRRAESKRGWTAGASPCPTNKKQKKAATNGKKGGLGDEVPQFKKTNQCSNVTQ